jgi:hypothetical protein
MSVSVESCKKPVSVVVVAGASAEYWRRHARGFPNPARFKLALPDVHDGEVKVTAGSSASDLVAPDSAGGSSGSSAVVLPSEFHVDKARQKGATTIVSGRFRNWSDTFVPVVAAFKANWLERSGLGHCFLKLPALVKDYSVFAAQFARNRVMSRERFEGTLGVYSSRAGQTAPYDPGVEIKQGLTTVRFHHGHVLSGDSLPVADRTVDGDPAWTCDGGKPRSPGSLRSKTAPDILIGRYGTPAAFSRAALEREVAGDCSAFVLLSQENAQRTRDILLLLIGAGVSLGAALLVELGLDLQKRRGKLS